MLHHFLLFGALQGFLFAAAVLKRGSEQNVTAQRLLAGMLSVVSLFLLVQSQNAHFSKFPGLFLLSYVLIYLYTPLFTLYHEAALQPSFQFNRKRMLQFLPPAFFLVVSMRYLVMEKNQLLHTFATGDLLDLALADFTACTANIFLVSRCISIRRSNRSELPPEIRSRMLDFLYGAMLVTNFLWLLVVIPHLGAPIPNNLIPLELVFAAMSVLLFLFGYLLITAPKPLEFRSIVQPERYRTTPMVAVQADEARLKIETVMRENKPFRDPDFDLQRLSELTGLDKVKLSYTLNQVMKTNFSELSNSYRVGLFVELVSSGEYKHLNMTGIAKESGFSSKSTFYKAFREVKGVTPGEFFNNQQIKWDE